MIKAIEVKKLEKVYSGKVKALNGIEFNVNAGEIFALLGPNGSGKTTLMRILTTQIKPTSGGASIFGLDVVKKDGDVRKRISYVPQETSVWLDISGFENLLIYAKIYGISSSHRNKIIWEALDTMGLGAVANNRVSTYSGGMIRRLEIACAMIVRPDLLFLDEPTIGLDPSARKAVWERLTSYNKEYGTTIFFNTHYMDEADHYSNKIAIIDKGSTVKIGTAGELKHSIRREVIQLSLMNGRVEESLLKRIKGLSFVSDAMIHNSDMEVIVEDVETALPGIMDILRTGGVSIERIATVRPTLDDAFLKYVGPIPQTGTISRQPLDRTGQR